MYPLFKNNEVVGAVKMEKVGLYCRFDCSCRPDTPGRYHVYAKTGEWELDLGLCVPEQGNFVLRTSISSKKIPQEEIKFFLAEGIEKSGLIPVLPHQPFLQLVQLKTARLVKQNGQQFICLSATPNQWDSGQSQEHLRK